MVAWSPRISCVYDQFDVFCTYFNTNPTGLCCEMCGSLRNEHHHDQYHHDYHTSTSTPAATDMLADVEQTHRLDQHQHQSPKREQWQAKKAPGLREAMEKLELLTGSDWDEGEDEELSWDSFVSNEDKKSR